MDGKEGRREVEKGRKRKRQRKKARRGEVVELKSEFEQLGSQPGAQPGKAAPSVGRAKKFVVRVSRPEDVVSCRETLPIVMMEQEIMEAIEENPIVIVCGETGCGKTTQVPQFLYEAGYGSAHCPERSGMIGVTQPRRVAVLATARRVAHELNVKLGQEVGFQVRHDRKMGDKSCVKFMTDGILLRELQADFLLRKYSVVVLDEAHERSLNTDILVGMLSRIIPLRQKLYNQALELRKKRNPTDEPLRANGHEDVKKLRVVVMSATLRVEDFTANSRMFPTPPPELKVPARQFPVTVHFSKKTELVDYAGAACRKVCAIHRKLPPGGILVFLTGQREVEDFCRRLRKCFRPSRQRQAGSGHDLGKQSLAQDGDLGDDTMQQRITTAVDGEQMTSENEKCFGRAHEEADVAGDENASHSSSVSADESEGDEPVAQQGALEKLRRSLTALSEMSKGDQLVADTLRDNASTMTDALSKAGRDTEPQQDTPNRPGPLHVLPLYAMLPAAAQLRVFSGAPKRMRLVVVATNVAETSITIPGVRYVVDCGRAKEKEIDLSSGIAKYEIHWISKASANQRAGRAGRTGPGHCYRLYSSAHFNNNFPQFALPEINKTTIEGVVLVMKSMGIDKVANFPFPSPPELSAVVEAERCLKALSALSPQTGLLTPIGQAMAAYPISPRHSRMLVEAIVEAEELASTTCRSDLFLAIAYAVAVAAVLSVEDPFLREVTVVEEDENFTVDRSGIKSDKQFNTLKDKDRMSESLQADQRQEDVDKAKRKLGRNKASAAHAKFKNVTSDAITVANSLRAYDQSKEQESFCQFHCLHAKTMHEMSKLRRQLWDLISTNTLDASICVRVAREGNCTSFWNKDVFAECEARWNASFERQLTLKNEELIRKVICAGWADKVARRLSVHERSNLPEAWAQKKHLAYRTCSSEHLVCLHPSASVSKRAPEFVVYNELVETSRTYMRRVTEIDSSWLVKQAEAVCTFSKPLGDPPPWYDSRADEVMCWVAPNFGRHLWDLPLHATPLKKGKHRSAVFACSLLQGNVLPALRKLKPHLTNDPCILLKPESQALKRVSDLMYRLGTGASDTRAKLGKVWDVDSSFLYSEILSWVQSNYQTKVKDLWTQLMQEAQLNGEELYGKQKF